MKTLNFSILLFVAAIASTEANASQWSQFRGHKASGLETRSPTPTTWNVETGKNILFQTPVTGLAHSAPIIGMIVFIYLPLLDWQGRTEDRTLRSDWSRR